MPNPSTRADSRVPQFRYRVPSDVLAKAKGRMIFVELPEVGRDEGVTVAARIGEHVKLSLRTRDPAAAKARHGAALAHVTRLFEGMRGEPKALSLREIVALSGDVYRLFLDECGDEPGRVDNWIALKAFNRAVKEGRIAAPPSLHVDPHAANEIEIARTVFGVDLSAGIDGLPTGTPEGVALEGRFGILANWTLMRRGVEIGPDDRLRLLLAVEKATTDAATVLKRRARMDFTPVPEIEARFPAFEPPAPAQPALTLTGLLERWRAEVKPAPKTLINWQSVLRRFRAYLGHDDATRVTPENVIGYKDHLIAEGLAPRTVARVHFIALHRLFGFAVDNRLLRDNPAHGVKLSAKVRAGEGKLGYEDADVGRLLATVAGEVKPERRFGPLLLALTGARAGEIFQLWAENVVERDGVHCIAIRPAPDGGRLKTAGSERIVPLHPAIIEAGFLDWVAGKGPGPLFYTKGKADPDAIHASNNATKRVGEWVKAKGFGSSRVPPLHGLRHWFKTAMGAAGVADSIADEIQGHSVNTAASGYRHPSIATMAAAVARLPSFNRAVDLRDPPHDPT